MKEPHHQTSSRTAGWLETFTRDTLTLDLRPRESVPTLEDPEAYRLAAEDAVAEADAVLDAGWRRWVSDHEVSPVPALRTSRARVTVVGERPETYHLVALVRFGFTLHGREFRGYARGPSCAPVFVVERVLDPAEVAPGSPRRPWRRSAVRVAGRKRLR